MKKVLMVSAFIPHYREELIKGLAQQCNLTVTSLNLNKFNLISPSEKLKDMCNFVTTKNIRLFDRFFKMSIVPKELKLLNQEWDVVFVFYSLRYPHRLVAFLVHKILRKNQKWIWVGHIYGRNNGLLTKFLRKRFLNSSDGVLTYTEEYVQRLKRDGIKVKIGSFNNTHLKKDDFFSLPLNYDDLNKNRLNLIYVGRFQTRKKLERLIELAYKYDDINIRLIGPEMEKLQDEIKNKGLSDRVHIFGPMIKEDLIPHFEWAHLVVNPGHAGLLVLTAGQYAKPIIIDSNADHAPEYIVAKDSNQFFVDWSDLEEVHEVLSKFKNDHGLILSKGGQLKNLIQEDYVVEKSVKAFMEFIDF